MRRSLIGSLLLALILPSFALADEPKAVIAPVEKAIVGEVVWIDASASTGDIFQWNQSESKFFKKGPGGVASKIAAAAFPEAGKYSIKVVAIGVVAGKAALDEAEVIIEIVPGPPPPPPAPVPPPGPTPPPGPGPDPVPPTPIPTPVVTGHLFVTYLADAANVRPAQAAMKSSVAIRTGFPALDATWRWYQSDEGEPAKLNLLAVATGPNGPGLPCVLFQSADGKVVEKLKAPTEAEVLATAKRLRGVK